jgi:8-oxo-dGTP diphosphatase
MTYQKASASGLIVNKSGKFLLIKRSETDDFLPGYFGLPGGGTEFNEHPVEGLKREIAEECGLTVEISHPLTAFSFVMPHEGVEKHTVEIVYLCKLTKRQKVNLSFEHCGYKWVNFSQIEKVKLNPILKELILNLKAHPLISSQIHFV